MRFIYSTKNIETFFLKLCISIETRPVVYRLYGESGSGKTTFLKCFASGRNDVLWISCEELKNLVCQNLSEFEFNEYTFSNYKYIIIENIEDLCGLGINLYFSSIVDNLCRYGKTVFITETREKPISLSIHHNMFTVRFIRIKPSIRIIREIANNNKAINRSEIDRILQDFDSLIGLESYIQRLQDE